MNMRTVHVSWDTADNGMRRLVAECDDEITELIFMGAAVFDEEDPAKVLESFGEMAVDEHQDRCQSCRDWSRRQ